MPLPLTGSAAAAPPMDSPFPAAELKVLWERFEGSPFAFWDRIYTKSKDAATVSQALDPLLAQGSDESFVQRILTAARGHPAQS
ncbi:MAG TPA: hypothetical protein DD643_08060 [Synechococcus sp. UBA8638]|nr:hypothetical protein [Synechococcus sp. UBA8638]